MKTHVTMLVVVMGLSLEAAGCAFWRDMWNDAMTPPVQPNFGSDPSGGGRPAPTAPNLSGLGQTATPKSSQGSTSTTWGSATASPPPPPPPQ